MASSRLVFCALAIGVSGLLVTVRGQDRPAASRAMVAELTAPAIDRGLGVRGIDFAARAAAAEREAGARCIPGSIIVKFRDGAAPGDAARTVAMLKGARSGRLAFADFEIVTIDRDADPELAAAAAAERPDVEYSQARYRIRPTFVPNDPLYARQWNFPAIGMERAWDINRGASSNIVVAVLDSGVAYRSATLRFTAAAFQNLPALGEITVPFAPAPELGGPERFVAPRDFIWDDTVPVDLDGHGTHVAGVIGQVTNNGVGVAGMAFNVRLMPVKVLDSIWDFIFDSPNFASDDTVARGIRYAADNGAHVLNLSIGRNGPPAPAIRSAIEYAVSRGSFVVVAAGNEFEDGNPINRIAEFARDIRGMVSVGATGRTNARAHYSSTGPYVELMAPGGDFRQGGLQAGILQQTYDLDFVNRFSDGPARYGPPRFDIFSFVYVQGTSAAVPHVSGFAALLMQQGIRNPAAIEAVMEGTATDLGASGFDNEHGFGLINPRAALRGMGLLQ